MKKIKIILLLTTTLLLFCFSAQAQRRLPGMSGIYAFGGLTEAGTSGFHGSIGYSRYLRNQQQLAYEFNYLRMIYRQENLRLPLEQYTVEGRYVRTFFMDRTRSFFLSAGVGATIGYETINLNRRLLPSGAMITNRDRFLYGGTLDIRASYYHQDHYVILVGIKQRVLFGTTVNNFRTQFYIGFKYVFQ